jgi:hypothetical protein
LAFANAFSFIPSRDRTCIRRLQNSFYLYKIGAEKTSSRLLLRKPSSDKEENIYNPY